MKKTIAPLLIGVIILFGASAPAVRAHELLPKELQEYIKVHPNATVEEIERFAASSTSEYVQKFGVDRQKLLAILRNRSTSLFDNAVDFSKLGIGHILSGSDHILFVLSLLLTFVSIREMLKLTATFTVAHSITLVLAGTGVLTLPSRIVEPLIALSIAYVAISSVFFKRRNLASTAHIGEDGSPQAVSFWQSEIPTVFFFGLFHGLGFAGLLKEIQIPTDRFASSVFFFNVGIELGQLMIIALALPLIYAFYRKQWYPSAIRGLAILFAIVASVWFVQRIFFV